MRTLLGMILGCLLTIAFVYMHDVRASSTVASTTAGVESRQIVHWDVATANWNSVRENARQALTRLKQTIS